MLNALFEVIVVAARKQERKSKKRGGVFSVVDGTSFKR